MTEDLVELRAELDRLRARVEGLEARSLVDPTEVAAELDRLQQERERAPAAQARAFDRKVRERAQARGG